MNQLLTKNPLFKRNETFKHKCAVQVLASWVDGIIEQPFTYEGQYIFVPDVAVYRNGVLTCIYEIVASHPLSSKKYGMIQYWCYLNRVDLTVYEVSADYILSLTEKPAFIHSMECYTVSLFEYEDIQDSLINPIN